jgi:hypothetical protein
VQYNASVSHIERCVMERNVRVIQYDLPRHRLAADWQAVVERQAGKLRTSGSCSRPHNRRHLSNFRSFFSFSLHQPKLVNLFEPLIWLTEVDVRSVQYHRRGEADSDA